MPLPIQSSSVEVNKATSTESQTISKTFTKTKPHPIRVPVHWSRVLTTENKVFYITPRYCYCLSLLKSLINSNIRFTVARYCCPRKKQLSTFCRSRTVIATWTFLHRRPFILCLILILPASGHKR